MLRYICFQLTTKIVFYKTQRIIYKMYIIFPFSLLVIFHTHIYNIYNIIIYYYIYKSRK